MKRKIPLIILCFVFLCVMGYSGIGLYQTWKEYHAGEKTYGELAQYVHLEGPLVPESIKQTTETNMGEHLAETSAGGEQSVREDLTAWPVVDFEALQSINPDVTAWIYLEGTVINYPVVQGSDNSEYLYRLVDRTSNSAGSIFMDYRNQADLSDRNTILYGHHMSNDTMFAQITEYKEQAFYEEHPTCLILTPEGNYKIEFFAGFVANLNSDAWKLEFGSNEEYGAWLERAMTNSTFQSVVSPTAQDRVVTLSTCSYEYNDARYVLMGILTHQS